MWVIMQDSYLELVGVQICPWQGIVSYPLGRGPAHMLRPFCSRLICFLLKSQQMTLLTCYKPGSGWAMFMHCLVFLFWFMTNWTQYILLRHGRPFTAFAELLFATVMYRSVMMALFHLVTIVFIKLLSIIVHFKYFHYTYPPMHRSHRQCYYAVF